MTWNWEQPEWPEFTYDSAVMNRWNVKSQGSQTTFFACQ
jgi:hypothetical protein